METKTQRNDNIKNLLVEFLQTVFIVVLSFVKAGFTHVISSLLWFMPGRRKDISDDIILITGGGKGLGRLIAVEFAKHKPKQIILWGRHEETLASTANVITLMNVSCDYMLCDVSVYKQVQQRSTEIRKKYGDVTICVNNAGIVYGNTIIESEPQHIKQTLDVNTAAHFWTTKAFLPSMMGNNHGHIVFINSMLGLMGLAGAADYCSSKYASLGFAESLKLELAEGDRTGVHVTLIHPFLLDTDMFAGCETRFPCLFPDLPAEYVAWKTVDAVLTNSYMVLLPRIMYILYYVKCFLPIDAMVAVHRFFGVDTTMKTFHGRNEMKRE